MKIKKLNDLLGEVISIDGEWLLNEGYGIEDFNISDKWLIVLNAKNKDNVSIEYFEAVLDDNNMFESFKKEGFTMTPDEYAFACEIVDVPPNVKVKIESMYSFDLECKNFN